MNLNFECTKFYQLVPKFWFKGVGRGLSKLHVDSDLHSLSLS